MIFPNETFRGSYFIIPLCSLHELIYRILDCFCLVTTMPTSTRPDTDGDVDPLDILTLPPPDETPSDRAARERHEQEAMQRNFQMTYAQKSWSEERLSWKAVILLNLVRSVNIMTDILESHLDMTTLSSTSRILTEHRNLKLFLGAGSGEMEATDKHRTDDLQTSAKLGDQEFCLHSSSGWKSILAQIRHPQPGKRSDLHRVAYDVVRGCKEDIQWLWKDTVTQRILHDRHLRLEHASGFFLNDVDRITALDYEPSDQDILCARLRTTGVQEYHFTLDRGNGALLDWIMYDVAGAAAWIPYFKEVTALIFLAPLSGFNERLEEDDRVNRLEDTLALWKTICSSKFLADVQIILFMNKVDILRKKIERDKVQVKKYIPDYDKPNDFENVIMFFRRAFKKIFVQNTPSEFPKGFMAHLTSVIDSKATAQTLYAVQATILRNDFLEAGLI
ncbi:guanine nucleotide binding protein, alpha subunit [Pholiota molesta]|nr:guanine nucleotide binding protein, alpha subunit [Pholiota molesta]